jgi:RNA polymerase sigma-70 factor (ECF subfamily)
LGEGLPAGPQELLLVTPQSPPQPSASIASETLFRLHARFVASFLYRLGLRGADVEDAVQEVFLTAHRRGGYRQGAASPTTFLAQLALEVNLARRRRASRSQPVDRDDLAAATAGEAPADPAQALLAKAAARRLQDALDAMDEGHRAVFVLFELEGESCESIAAGLAIPVGTVFSRLHAARRAFREHVARGRRDEGAPRRALRERDLRIMVAKEPV